MPHQHDRDTAPSPPRKVSRTDTTSLSQGSPREGYSTRDCDICPPSPTTYVRFTVLVLPEGLTRSADLPNQRSACGTCSLRWREMPAVAHFQHPHDPDCTRPIHQPQRRLHGRTPFPPVRAVASEPDHIANHHLRFIRHCAVVLTPHTLSLSGMAELPSSPRSRCSSSVRNGYRPSSTMSDGSYGFLASVRGNALSCHQNFTEGIACSRHRGGADYPLP